MSWFSDEERRGLLLLIPLFLIALLLLLLYDRGRPSMLEADAERYSQSADSVVLKDFNPNTYEYEQLREAGLPADIAVGIVRWRKYGKKYRMKEDLALVTGMTDSIYAVLKPHIVIDKEYEITPRYSNDYRSRRDTSRYDSRRRVRDTVALQPFMIDTASAHYLYLLGFSRRQADVIVRYVDMLGGLRGEEELRDCYVISDSMADRILPYVIFDTVRYSTPADDMPVDINSADTAALRRVYGIGAKSAAEIVRYRELLGGYYSVEQLCELKCITERNYERFFAQICCDSCKITKIDINFASPKSLMRHPYISSSALRRIVKQRQLKGGWSRIEEMVEQNIFTEEEARRLAPYLRFRLRATE